MGKGWCQGRWFRLLDRAGWLPKLMLLCGVRLGGDAMLFQWVLQVLGQVWVAQLGAVDCIVAAGFGGGVGAGLVYASDRFLLPVELVAPPSEVALPSVMAPSEVGLGESSWLEPTVVLVSMLVGGYVGFWQWSCCDVERFLPVGGVLGCDYRKAGKGHLLGMDFAGL